MKEPGDLARSISEFTIPDGTGDRFSGYAVFGLPFSSGHILALRRFESSSVGAAYTSVWHRNPKGRWTFHQNVPPDQSCPRYFGAAISENTTEPIRIEWTDRRRFCVTVDAPGEIVWDVCLAPTPATRMINAAASALPASWWRRRSLLSTMETAARWMLGTGRMNLTGCTPNGQLFTAAPRLIWSIAQSRATIRGVDAGTPAPLPKQATLGDFYVPQRGIFAVLTSVLEGQWNGATAGAEPQHGPRR
ncbi:MAG TPA: hypothetical protein VLY24_05640 [Bryobacteraceae bacterium]|nr:hypothetical protein [Bryobacteraceae bacterium]